MAIKLLIFGIGIVVLIFLHEFGHFVACKLLGIGVEEFGFGFPPRIATLFEAGGTKFTLNALPFGGFVRPRGETDEKIKDGMAAASPLKRIAMFMAGPIMNLALAVVLFYAVLAITGTMLDRSRIEIDSVGSGTPAAGAGLQAGDVLVSIDGTKYHSTGALHNEIYSNLGEPLVFVYERNGVSHSAIIVPVTNPGSSGAIGISMRYGITPFTITGAIPESFLYLRDYAAQLFTTIGQIARGQGNSTDARLTGFKGMFDIFSFMMDNTTGNPKIADVLGFFAIISFSLGFMNLLPIPPLDGGKIAFALPELIIHRRIPVKYEVWVSSIAFLLLIILMIYINAQDFIHPIVLPTP